MVAVGASSPASSELGSLVFGEFVVDLRERRLTRHGGRVDIAPKTFDVLVFLALNGGHLVSKDELLGAVWRDRVVTENALTRVIKEVRRALGDAAANPRYVETVRQSGYRFIADVKRVGHIDRVPRRPYRIVAGIATVVLLLTAGLWVAQSGTNSLETHAIESPSIAVMPFADMTEAGDSAYLGEGLAEALLHRLAQDSNLLVVSRTSSFALAKRNLPMIEIAKRLSVSHVLEGSIRSTRRGMLVTAQLIDARGFHVWSETYGQDSEELAYIQESIADQIAARLSRDLGGPELSRRAVRNDAYRLYLEALGHFSKRTIVERNVAAQKFRRALDIEPNFAEAMVGLAATEMLGSRGDQTESERVSRGVALVGKALGIDPRLGEAHALLGLAATMAGDANPARAQADALGHYNRALELNPNFADAYVWRATVHGSQGRLEASINDLERARSLNPLHSTVVGNLAFTLHRLGRRDEALQLLEDYALIPDGRGAIYYNLIALYRAADRFEPALRWARASALEYPHSAFPSGQLAMLYADLGLTDIAKLWASRGAQLAAGLGPGLSQAIESMLRLGDAPAARTLKREPAYGRGGEARNRAVIEARFAHAEGEYQRVIGHLVPYYGSVEQITGDAGDLGWIVERVHLLAFALQRSGQMTEARALLGKAASEIASHRSLAERKDSSLSFNQARNHALLGDPRAAMDKLRQGASEGWLDLIELENDARWSSLRAFDDFQSLLADLRRRQQVARAAALAEVDVAAFEERYQAVSQQLAGTPPGQ